MDLDKSLSWFHRKLGRYDKASWERTLEEQEQEKISAHILKKPGNLKPELIDVDLVVGSTFHKAKPVHTWFDVARKGLCRVIFYPFYGAWWKQQTSTKIWLLFLFLYFCEILSLVIYIFVPDTSIKIVSWTEVYGPAMVMILLGTLHFQVVSTDYDENIRRRRKTKQIKKRRVNRQKKDGNGERTKGTFVQNGDLVDHNGYHEVTVRKRKADKLDNGEHGSINMLDVNQAMDTKENLVDNRSEDDASVSSDSETASTSDSDVSDMDMDSINEDDPYFASIKSIPNGEESSPTPPTAEIVMVSVWEGKQCKKAHMTLMEISAAIANKVETHKGNNGYIHFSTSVSVILAIVPLLFRIYSLKDLSQTLNDPWELFSALVGYTVW